MRRTIAKAVTWRLIGTAEIFAISFWTTGHIATAGSTAGIAAITSIVMYVAHELAWEHERPDYSKLLEVKEMLVRMLDCATLAEPSSHRTEVSPPDDRGGLCDAPEDVIKLLHHVK